VIMVSVITILGERTLRVDVSTNRQAASLFQSVMSPFCPGLTLAACPSAAAVSLRADILRRLEDGQPREAIISDLVATYGDRIRGTPDPSGIALLLWILPGVM